MMMISTQSIGRMLYDSTIVFQVERKKDLRLQFPVVHPVRSSQVKWGSPPHVGLNLPVRPPGGSHGASASAWRKPNGGRNWTGGTLEFCFVSVSGAKHSAPPFVAQWRSGQGIGSHPFDDGQWSTDRSLSDVNGERSTASPSLTRILLQGIRYRFNSLFAPNPELGAVAGKILEEVMSRPCSVRYLDN